MFHAGLFFLICLIMLVFVGHKTPSVSWLQDDKHGGIRLRHFKVFPYLSTFPFCFACWLKFLSIVNIKQ